MINSKDQALSDLPKAPIQMNDNVFPARVIVNSLIANQNYILNNTNNLQSNTVLDKTANWNTLEPQTTFQFHGLGVGAPDENVLGTDKGLVTTLSTQEKRDPFTMQIVIAETGLAYRVTGQDWSYLGHQVPNNIDANNLIDRETLNGILENTLQGYTTNYTFSQGMASASGVGVMNEDHINSVSNSVNSLSSSANANDSSLSTEHSDSISSLNTELYSDQVKIEDNYNNINSYQSSADSLNNQVNGSVSADGYRYGGVFGNNGLSSLTSDNQQRLNSSNDSMENISTAINTLYGDVNDNHTTIGITQSEVNSTVAKSNAENLPASVSSNANAIQSLNGSLVPWAKENRQLLNSIATTTYTNSYASIDVIKAQSLTSNSNPSNFTPILSNVYLEANVPYEFKANVGFQFENTATSPNYASYQDVTGTVGFSKDNATGIDYQLLNQQSNDLPIPNGFYSRKNSFNQLNSNGNYVQINYPYTNLDIDNQLNSHTVDIIFVPNTDEKLNLISVPAESELKAPTYTDIQLIEHKPLSSRYNTNSLLSATVDSMSQLYDQYNTETSVNNSNIVLNNQIANNAMSGASQANSYLNSAPRISLAPTYSYANSCSNQTSQYVFLYPQYDNDKEEKAIDWCLSEITPQQVRVYGNWPANTPTDVLINQCKNLTAGIIANIMSAQLEYNGAVADPQNPDVIQDWTHTNYLNWNLTSDYDTSSILNYLNSTLKREPNQEWDGWEAYLGLHATQENCALWLADQINNPGFDVTQYADKVRKLLY